MKKKLNLFLVCGGVCILSFAAKAQGTAYATDTVLPNATLQTCISYALRHYPLVQQALLDERITEHQIRSRLADWYPQVNFNFQYDYYFKLPSFYFNGNVTSNGTNNTSTLGLNATQNIFNRDVLLASRTAGDVRKQARQATATDKIDVVVNVSKAFYDVLLTQQQIDVLADDIRRLERNLKDAYNQYQGGLVDKTDYKRATISLNNSKAEKKTDEEALKAKYALLKQQMGYLGNENIQLVYDSVQMEGTVYLDTLAVVDYNNRIEYQTLMTQKRLELANLQYNKWSYLPTLSAVGAYNFSYLNNQFSKLYSQDYPNSYAGLQLTFP
ncbi:MAG: TolC family protein, partial [Bacteroidota bacterium]|nr:TolC family protein [Bacteroidota bacterium]